MSDTQPPVVIQVGCRQAISLWKGSFRAGDGTYHTTVDYGDGLVVLMTSPTFIPTLGERVDVWPPVRVEFRHNEQPVARVSVDSVEQVQPGEMVLFWESESWERLDTDNAPFPQVRHTWNDDQAEVERAVIEFWKKINRVNPGLNYGMGEAQDVILSVVEHGDPGPDFDPILTQRERRILATFVAWMATNCGQSFVRRLGQVIKNTREDVRKHEHAEMAKHNAKSA